MLKRKIFFKSKLPLYWRDICQEERRENFGLIRLELNLMFAQLRRNQFTPSALG